MFSIKESTQVTCTIWAAVITALTLLFLCILPGRAPAQFDPRSVQYMPGLACEASDEIAIYVTRTYDAGADDTAVMDSLNADEDTPVCKLGYFYGVIVAPGATVRDGKGQSWRVIQVNLIGELDQKGMFTPIDPPAVRWTAVLVKDDPA